MSVSSVTKSGIDKAWSEMVSFEKAMNSSGELLTKRSEQMRKWMWNNIKDRVLDSFLSDETIKNSIKSYEDRVRGGFLTPFVAADAILDLFLSSRKPSIRQKEKEKN